MKRAFILGLILLFAACDKDHSLTKPISTTGTIHIIIADKSTPAANVPDSLNTVKKTAKPARLDQLEVRVLKSDNSVLANKIVTSSNGNFQVSMTVEAQNDLKVLCIGTFSGVVGYFGIDEDVDVQAGKTTTAIITGWNDAYLAEIGDIAPNPSTDGSYTVSWTQAPNATIYVLQEASNEIFAGAANVYSGSGLKQSFSGKASGTFYYRIQASNIYNITSSWSASVSVIVQKTYTISGTITGGSGATVTLSGNASDTQIADDNGYYSFTVAHGGSYTITPSKTDYTFTPASQTFNNVTTDITAHFTASYSSITYTISGTVTGADGVLVTLSGNAFDSQPVNDGGSYSFTVAEGNDYTITPSKTGYTFTPANQMFNNVTSNQTQNFTATEIPPNTYTISGIVSGADGITVTLSGDKSESIAVNDGAAYSFLVDEGGNYTVIPSKSGFTFTPTSKDFTDVTSNQTQDFIASEIVVPLDITMVSIPSGSFRMGDISGVGESNELPVHTVTLTGFAMSAYEITQEQYEAIMGRNPSSFSGTNLPVETVSWYDAVQFCNALSEGAGLTLCYNESTWECDFSVDGFRLPTEAEWEYACRAGTETKYYTGNSDSDLGTAGWYGSNSSSKTHLVGQKTANAFGLYDMHGNVWEWCNDWYVSAYYESSPSVDPTGLSSGSLRMKRGGGWYDFAVSCRSAFRYRGDPSISGIDVGFRIVRGSFTPGTKTYTISGAISGADGVTITLSGDVLDSQVVATDGGSYSFTVTEGGNYTVTPSKSGYTFSPASQTFNNVTSNQTQNFTATMLPVTGGKITFNSDRDGKLQIYVMDADGSNQTRITNNQNYDFGPSWSPDGSRIAFGSDRDGNFGTANEIYIMNADGSNQTRLTNNPANDNTPCWSPDGSSIAYVSNYQTIGGYIDIFVMNADGSNQRNITNVAIDDFSPSWSPDSSQIAFDSRRGGNSEIYFMNVDGSNLINVTNNPAVDRDPSWSPDGSRIAFYSDRDGNIEIYVMNADGSNQTRLTNNPAIDYGPSWSPDSSQIVFYSKRDGNDEIYVMDADGSNLTNLTNNPANDYAPSWSPF